VCEAEHLIQSRYLTLRYPGAKTATSDVLTINRLYQLYFSEHLVIDKEEKSLVSHVTHLNTAVKISG